MGRHPGIDFKWIWVDFGRQVGKENRAKRHQKWHRKNDEKMKGNKMAEKSQQDVPTTSDPTGPGPWGGVGGGVHASQPGERGGLSVPPA